jgi:hypothetical protein
VPARLAQWSPQLADLAVIITGGAFSPGGARARLR